MSRPAVTAAAAVLLLLVPTASAGRLAPSADGRRATVGRALLQDCSVVPYCDTCRYERRTLDAAKGPQEVTVCQRCKPGYTVTANGLGCDCAQGFYRMKSTGTCEPCGLGDICQGSAALPVSCNATTMGTTTLATQSSSFMQCVTQPGYGMVVESLQQADAAPKAELCAQNFFNTGYNRNPCRRCMGGLVTQFAGSTNATACVAKAGYFFDKGVAKPCPRGTYQSTDFHRLAFCNTCGVGLTTPAVGSTSVNDCSLPLAGYSFALTMQEGQQVPTATVCGAGTFSTGVDVNNKPITQCQPCDGGLTTRTPGAKSAAACSAPPGYTVVGGAMQPCDGGSYKGSWGRRECTKCGDGYRTASPGASGFSQCYVPAGFGTERADDTSKTRAVQCAQGTYGVASDTYGVRNQPCRACPAGMTTADVLLAAGVETDFTKKAKEAGFLFTSPADCWTLKGYGYEAKSQMAQPCDYGFFASGGTKEPCGACPTGYTTTAIGASSQADCVLAAGFELVDDGKGGKTVTQCAQGTYSAIGSPSCNACPAGTTTTPGEVADNIADCNLCLPGYGSFVAVGANGAPTCTQCAAGSYAAGNSGAACDRCPAARPLSAAGSTNVDDCFAQWQTVGDLNANAGGYVGYLPQAQMLPGSGGSLEECKASCAANPDCLLASFFVLDAKKGGAPGCFLSVEPAKPDAQIGFKLATSVYVTYWASAGNLPGRPLSAAFGTTMQDCASQCDKRDACVAAAVVPDDGAWDKLSADPAGAKVKCFLLATQIANSDPKTVTATSQWRASGLQVNAWGALLTQGELAPPAAAPATQAIPLLAPYADPKSDASTAAYTEASFACPAGYKPYLPKSLDASDTGANPYGTRPGCLCLDGDCRKGAGDCKDAAYGGAWQRTPVGQGGFICTCSQDGRSPFGAKTELACTAGTAITAAPQAGTWRFDASAPSACTDPVSCFKACFYSDGTKRYPSGANGAVPSATPGCSARLGVVQNGLYNVLCSDSLPTATVSFAAACDNWADSLKQSGIGLDAAAVKPGALAVPGALVSFTPSPDHCAAPPSIPQFDTRIPTYFAGTCSGANL